MSAVTFRRRVVSEHPSPDEQTEIVVLRQQVAELEARCQAVTAERDTLQAQLQQADKNYRFLGATLKEQIAAEATLRATLGSRVAQWRGVANRHKTHGDCYRVGQGWGMEHCATELEQVLGAAPREGQ